MFVTGCQEVLEMKSADVASDENVVKIMIFPLR